MWWAGGKGGGVSVDEAVRLALATAGGAAPAAGPIGEGDQGDLVAQACITLADWLAACPEPAAAAWAAAHKVGHAALVERAPHLLCPACSAMSTSCSYGAGSWTFLRAVLCLKSPECRTGL